MNDDVAQKIQDIYETLPQDVKDVLASEDAGKKLEAISIKHNLHIDQASDLSDLTTMVMLGIIPSQEFIPRIQSDVNLSASEATVIADEINEQILRDIKSLLINLSGEKSETLTKPKEDYSTLTAKDILHEIENPLPIKQNISVAPKPLVEGTGINLVAGKVTPPVIPQAAVVPQPENSTPIAPVPSPTTPPNIIEQKLNQTVRAPEPQKVELTTKPISKLPPLTNKSTAASGGTDPYRESF